MNSKEPHLHWSTLKMYSFELCHLLFLSCWHLLALTFLHLFILSGPWGREQEPLPFPSSCHSAEHWCVSTTTCLFTRGWTGALVWISMQHTFTSYREKKNSLRLEFMKHLVSSIHPLLTRLHMNTMSVFGALLLFCLVLFVYETPFCHIVLIYWLLSTPYLEARCKHFADKQCLMSSPLHLA